MGCRRAAAPPELVRLAAAPDGSVRPGPGPGRGAWLCAGSPGCWEAAVRRGAVWRALRRPALPDPEIRALRARLFDSDDKER
ncbi:MAG: YlxR family protein [Acidimicrobiia bacterium]